MNKIRERGSKAWKFFWKDDSIWSLLANIIVAFLLIRYVLYPVLGIVLGTSFPIVAVVSESMEHGLHNERLCDVRIENFRESFDNYWDYCGSWYENIGISKQQFKTFSFRNGFDKGDVIILWRANQDNIKLGDILVFEGGKAQPIIHRVVEIDKTSEDFIYQTKGDHNSGSIPGTDTDITSNRIFGKGLLRIPYLGWVKILFVDAVKPLGIVIER